MLLRLVPAIFVCLWATGFIGAKAGLGHAEPFTFLALRFAIVAAILLVVVLALRLTWPGIKVAVYAFVIGMAIHGVYLGGVYWAIDNGFTASVSALVASLQPALTAALAVPLLGEALSRRQIAGIVLGLLGIAFVLGPGVLAGAATMADGITPATLAASIASLCGITLGTIAQKRFPAAADLRMGALFQYLGALSLTGLAAVTLETGRIDWTGEFILALGWLTIVLSIGAIMLLLELIRRNAVSQVATLFYMVPVVVAVLAAVLFGERLLPMQLLGMALVVASILLGSVGRRPQRAT
ncbi:MAG: EamA family transporter [Rhizobiales bacterium]|nr:EamA family transporter [Hyphomicrobiales bacterium]